MSASGNVQLIPIDDVIHGSPYQAYTYSYPHKTAYRTLDPPVALSELWQAEQREALFLYLHVPFCEHRCGFCNLFTQANPESGLSSRYLNQLQRESEIVREALGERSQFVQLAIGGGTPTFLNVDELERLLAVCRSMGAAGQSLPVSVEVSPATVTREKMAMLSEFGADRISIGIQSFNEEEAHRLGRPQRTVDVVNALQAIRDARFPVLNIDLIYGGEGQSVAEWMVCVREACRWQPEELYLYPLYVRPLTGLGRLDRQWDDQRLEAYRAARDFLVAEGYEQVSMRMFRRPSAEMSHLSAQNTEHPVYRCQTDGMVGLGCGARSYTTGLHYSTEYAVGRSGVRSILLDYINREPDSFSQARYGMRLTPEDHQRRFAILSLLQTEGLNRQDYRVQFGSDAMDDLAELAELVERNLATVDDETMRLTDSGLERSDAIGPWLYSDRVRERMQEYELV